MKSKTKRQINKFTALCLITTLILSVFSMIPRTASAKALSQFELEDLQQEELCNIQSTSSFVNDSTISAESMVVGDTVEMKAVGSGGTAPYTYIFYYKSTDASAWKVAQNYSEKDTATLTLSSVGTYDICIKVKDSTGKIVKKYFTLTVVDGPLTTKSHLNTNSIQLGQSIQFIGVGIGGQAPYTYAFFYKKSDSNKWTCVQSFKTNRIFQFTPTETGSFDVCVKIKDSVGTEVKNYLNFKVLRALSSMSFVSDTAITVDKPLKMTGMGIDGAAPYQFAFFEKNVNDTEWTTLSEYSKNDSLFTKFDHTGTYSVCIKVKDSQEVISEQEFTITVDSTPLTNDSYISATDITLGESVTLTGTGYGGAPSYEYTFCYKLKGSSTWSVLSNYSSANIFDFTPRQAGTYDICIKTRDTENTVSKRYFTLDVKEKEFTVHFYNYNNWENVKVYCYDDNGEKASWPGEDMTSENDGWYSYKITQSQQANVIFNDGSTVQMSSGQESFSVNKEMWYRNGVWIDSRPNDIIVNFYKPENWSSPNIYYYISDTDKGPEWPGTAMTELSDGWYSYTITKYDSAKVIFNDGNTQIPLQNQPGFDATGTMFYKDGIWCNSETDTDNDDLLDYLELILNSDINNSDTDNDGLPDGYEVNILKTDPTKADSNNNGVNDSEEDADSDSLSNLEECQLGTDSAKTDTDNDGLKDGEEVHTHQTDPLKQDTDGDTLSDNDEIVLGFNPLVKDTNGDGVLDCDESVQQSLTKQIEDAEKPEVVNVSIDIDANKNINKTTTIKSIYNQDVMSSNVKGLVGSPIEIETTSNFDTATITFEYDEASLNGVDENNLGVLWYDEDNNIYRLQDSEVDSDNNKVSVNVTHFSKYMLVDKQQWFNNWSRSISYRDKSECFNTVIMVECTASSCGNDPFFFDNVSNEQTCYRRQVAESYINAKNDDDNIGVILFSNEHKIECEPTTSKISALDVTSKITDGTIKNNYKYDRTIFENSIDSAIDMLNSNNHNKTILLIGNGWLTVTDEYFEKIKRNNIKINTVYTGGHAILMANRNSINRNSSYSEANETLGSSRLRYIAEETGGEFFEAVNTSEIENISDYIAIMLGIDTRDSDQDGLYDVFEKQGIRLSNGEIVYTDPNNPDSDYDGLWDGEEVVQDFTLLGENMYFSNFNDLNISVKSQLVLKAITNPNSPDSDNDGLLDGSCITRGRFTVAPKDPYPLRKDPMASVWQAQIKQAEQGRIGTKCQATAVDGAIYSADQLLNNVFQKYNLNRCLLDGITNTLVIQAVNTALSLRKDIKNNKESFSTVMKTIKRYLGYIWDYDLAAKISADIGATVLNFHHSDVQSNTYHALPGTWQKPFGYNELYDDVFDISSEMRIGRCFFNMSSNPNDLDNLYVIWAWRGDYWNLGAGCEVGLYKYSRTVDDNDHFDASPIDLPMSLNMYVLENNTISSSFNWYPNADQWWITGFDYTRQSQNPDSLVTTGYIDFSDHIDMYEKIKDSQKLDDNKKLPNAMNLYPYLIFDETNHYVWFMWYS